jgi:dolichyl-phosphate-mannose-protein mannosyltransferase
MKLVLKNLASIKYLLLFAFLLRIFLVYFQYSGDVGNHLAWGRGVLEGTFGFFDRTFPGFNGPNYPPLTIIFFGLSAWLYEITNQFVIYINQAVKIFPSNLVHLMETLNMQSSFLKLPAILADLGVGWLIYKLTPSKKKSHKLLASSLYLLNPAVIYISTVWGQIESIPIFFVLLSIYFAKKKYYLSHISFVLAILSKQTALWLLPVFFVLWFKKQSPKVFLKGILLQVVIFILLYFPFSHSLFEPFSLYLKTLAGSSNLVSDAAWNIWHFIYPAGTLDSALILGISIRLWSIFLISISTVFIVLSFLKNKITLYQSLFWLSMVAFFMQTRVHERHLFPALVFLLLIFKPSVSKVAGFLSLTLFHLFNLYWSLGLPFI